MAYVAPAGNEADFDFAGAYTPPAGGSADFSWVFSGTPRATGARNTTFGTPVLALIPSGWQTTNFGIPGRPFPVTGIAPGSFGSPRLVQYTVGEDFSSTTFGLAAIVPRAESINSTQFGTPNSPYLQTGVADGIYSTNVSMGHRLVHVGLVFASTPSTTIPQAYTPSDQTAEATGVTRTTFGRTRLLVPPDITDNLTLYATGARNTSFGTPNSPYTQAKTASGFSNGGFGWPRAWERYAFTVFGTPSVEMTQAATALNSTAQFGTPTLVFRSTALGPAATFGTPVAQIKYLASTVPRRARFGTPVAFPGGHRAYGIDVRSKFGQPTSTNRINRQATGWASTSLGEPSGAQKHRATFLPTVARFGTPLLIRSPQC